MVHVFNPDTPEAEAGESELETSLVYIVSTGQPELCSETLTLNYINRKAFPYCLDVMVYGICINDGERRFST